jgi:four helix bundle protein
MSGLSYFEHEQLDVYKAAKHFAIAMDGIAEGIRKLRAHLADQLFRASSSILFNIAEGAGEQSRAEKSRFYRIARRSATECASILELCHDLRLLEKAHYLQHRDLLLRIVAMLTKMVRGTTYSTHNAGMQNRTPDTLQNKTGSFYKR